MLVWGAILLLVAVVVGLVALLVLDMRRDRSEHWLTVIHRWQGLLGSVLGFLSGAGVLVLGASLATYQEDVRQAEASHALGVAAALEVERLALGLQLGQQFGNSIDLNGTNLVAQCLNYSLALQRALNPATPIFDAVLPQMVDFGDDNLSTFVRFYAYYSDFVRSLPEVDQAACEASAAGEIGLMLSLSNGGMVIYDAISQRYDIALPQPVIAP